VKPLCTIRSRTLALGYEYLGGQTVKNIANGNGDHLFGLDLSEDEKNALVEYLKVLMKNVRKNLLEPETWGDLWTLFIRSEETTFKQKIQQISPAHD